ncbi:MAG: polymer-forming cytoskeletal protein [Candidatus Zixiibacteriota bacterium]|nr:MAG: polymer-forming cytoskeletal protein [candidate division Zixibacteria bacterium]
MKNRKDRGGEGLNTIIGKDSVIEGTIKVQGGVRIDGAVRGRISASESLAVGDTGTVEAELAVKTAVIGGKVFGNIFAQDKIELQSKAVVEGDVTTKNLVVEEGAVFHGRCNMKETSTEPPPPQE